jgi:hypothetical protein
MMCSLSHLDEQVLNQIKSLETDLGKSLLAFSCHDIKPSSLESDELKKIEELEKKLGISIVAVKA